MINRIRIALEDRFLADERWGSINIHATTARTFKDAAKAKKEFAVPVSGAK